MNDHYGGDNTPVPPMETGGGKYILVDRVPVPCPDLHVWGQWIEQVENKRVAETTIKGSWVSTVFLGLDHSFGGQAPILFETLVLRGKLDGDMRRYHTWEEAVEGHVQMCKRVYEAEASELEQAVKKVRDDRHAEA